ncbi:pyridoxal-dependent decarboxylase [Fennellomyces sp. T-0311]|nr:pyridoxal-dependent decarboxylase [Fennellomyces sp. T-0311]
MAFDNEDELYKIKNIYPNAKLVLRMLVDDSKSGMKLGGKYGAPPNTIPRLLRVAKKLELNVVGVSFRFGSGCTDERAFYDAMLGARHVFDQGKVMGFNFTLLDVGGGFSKFLANEHGITFEKTAKVLGSAVDEMLPPAVRVIAEPGRYYVATGYTLCTKFIVRRIILPGEDVDANPVRRINGNIDSEQKIMYYMSKGVYGSFLLPRLEIFKYPLRKEGTYCHGRQLKEKMYKSSFRFPTCCPRDCVVEEEQFPLLNIGHWLYSENAGAYAPAGASGFNGFEKAKFYHTNTLDVP